MTETHGGALIAKMLKAEGVDTAFGIVDGSYLMLCAALRDQGIELFTPRHETIGMHMAGAYARMTGKLGVALASNGPGVANVLSGVAVEAVEGNRVLLITSCRRSPISYPDRGGAYQCFDQVAAIRPMVKWSQTVPSFDRIGEITRDALRHCFQGRPGVVHLDVPEDLINGKGEAPDPIAPARYRRTAPVFPDPAQVEAAAQMLADAKLPVIHAGGGVLHAGAFAELAELAELLGAPVTTSWSARGVLREGHPMAWPMVHVKPVNEVRKAADVIVALGSRIGETDWWGKQPYWGDPGIQKLIQVDLDDDVLGRNRPADLAVLADVKVFLARLNEALRPLRARMPMGARETAVAKLARGRDKDRAKLDSKLEDRSAPMLTAHLSHVCDRVMGDDAIAVFDGGNTTVWASFFHRVRVPNTLLATHHMGHLGAGMGQALGAAIAHPDRQVFCIIGDGAFGMHPQEVETAVRHDLKVVWLVASDRQWGMVKMTQSMAFHPYKMLLKKKLAPEETINSDLAEIEYDKLGQAMGAHGERIASPDEIEPALKRALASGKPAVIHVDVDPAKHLWAPALMHFKAMHAEPKGK